MNKIRLLSLVLNFYSFFVNAQTSSEIELLLTTNTISVEQYINPIKITNTNDVIVGGMFISENYVRVTAIPNSSIVFKSPGEIFNRFNPLPEVSTGIKIKPPSGGLSPIRITIYPNPVQTDLTYVVTNSLVSSCSIYNMSGISLFTESVTPSNTGVINVSNLTNGNYILKLGIINGQQISIQFNKN